MLTAVRLRTEYRENPVGIDVSRPRLSWWLAGDNGELAQSAYQVQVAIAGGEPDGLWDSGKVTSSRNAHVEYEGAPLQSRAICQWRVRVWDERDSASPWSAPASWEMGLLEEPDWVADWVQDPASTDTDYTGRPSLFRQEFFSGAPVAKARLVGSALGLYFAEINGQRVSDACLRPGWTDYPTRTQYQVHDVTGLVRDGQNALGAVLADGWYSGRIAWVGPGLYGKRPALRLQLELTFEDGRQQTVATSPAWQCAAGPWLSADLILGESYDARLARPGWSSPGAAPADWHPVEVFGQPAPPLVAECAEPVRPLETVAAVSSRPSPDGTATIFDLGTNMVGRVRLALAGAAGVEVVVRHAEILDGDGGLYTTNLRKATATDRYVMSGDPGGEFFEPEFTFHGFQFVEVAGLGSALPTDCCQGVVIGSAYPKGGEFDCSDPLVNTLQRNLLRSMRGNFLDIPTDCPQRDERLGWMGDAQVFARTATCNGGVAPFFTKYLQDVLDARTIHGFTDVCPVPIPWEKPAAPGWGDAGVIIPWTVYRVYGDTRVLARSYPSMRHWIDGLIEVNPDLRWRERRANDYGDWLSLGKETSKELIGSAYLAHSIELTGRAAAVLREDADAARYGELLASARASFADAYVDADGIREPTQTACVLALHFELVPAELRSLVVDQLVALVEAAGGHLETGFLGVEHLLPVLDRAGRLDLAYGMLLNRTFPSWGYSIDNGATSIWERWDGWTHDKGFQDPAMNSFNHYSLGSVGAWLVTRLLGIDLDPDVAGFGQFRVWPQPGGGISWARGWQETMAGRIEAGWRISDGKLHLSVDVPVNATATVHRPGGAEDTQTVAAGHHEFSWPWAS